MKNKTLTIDCAKWRCGDDSVRRENKLGTGPTKMLNESGHMCCLGQMSVQLNKKLKPENILSTSVPESCGMYIPFLTNSSLKDTVLASEAILINDNEDTTVKEKIRRLRTLFKKKNITLRFINQKVIK
jgi:hypothetical protein